MKRSILVALVALVVVAVLVIPAGVAWSGTQRHHLTGRWEGYYRSLSGPTYDLAWDVYEQSGDQFLAEVTLETPDETVEAVVKESRGTIGSPDPDSVNLYPQMKVHGWDIQWPHPGPEDFLLQSGNFLTINETSDYMSGDAVVTMTFSYLSGMVVDWGTIELWKVENEAGDMGDGVVDWRGEIRSNNEDGRYTLNTSVVGGQAGIVRLQPFIVENDDIRVTKKDVTIGLYTGTLLTVGPMVTLESIVGTTDILMMFHGYYTTPPGVLDGDYYSYFSPDWLPCGFPFDIGQWWARRPATGAAFSP